MWIVKMFLISLALTLVTESIVAYLFGVRWPGMKVVWLVNTLTNPAAVWLSWFLSIRLEGVPAIARQFPIEAVVFLAEALIYREFAKDPVFRIRRPVLLSLTANAVAWGLGLLL